MNEETLKYIKGIALIALFAASLLPLALMSRKIFRLESRVIQLQEEVDEISGSVSLRDYLNENQKKKNNSDHLSEIEEVLSVILDMNTKMFTQAVADRECKAGKKSSCVDVLTSDDAYFIQPPAPTSSPQVPKVR